MRDILYCKRNKNPDKQHIDHDTYTRLLNLHRNVSSLDYKLYGSLLSDFSEERDILGDRFKVELEVFRKVNREYNEFCNNLYNYMDIGTSKWFDKLLLDLRIDINPSPFGKSFSVCFLDCVMFHLRSRVLRNILKVRQYPQLCDT